MKLMPGDQISYKVFYLEMNEPPDFDWPQKPPGNIFIWNSIKPSTRYFFDLYAAVGSEYEWTDKYEVPIKELDDFLSHPFVRMFTFVKDGWTAGFFILDNRIEGICDLAYFGLVPEVIGCGYGGYLLKFAVKESWEAKDIQLLTVNTNSLDHPSALPLYKKVGFKLKNIEHEKRTLTRSRNVDNDRIIRIG